MQHANELERKVATYCSKALCNTGVSVPKSVFKLRIMR